MYRTSLDPLNGPHASDKLNDRFLNDFLSQVIFHVFFRVFSAGGSITYIKL